MMIQCPNCQHKLTILPSQLLGKYLVCPLCHQPFRWEADPSKETITSPENCHKSRKTSGGNPPVGGAKPPASAANNQHTENE